MLGYRVGSCFSTLEMRAVKEVIVAGHEPRLCEWGWYKGGGTTESPTDIQWLARIGNNVVPYTI